MCVGGAHAQHNVAEGMSKALETLSRVPTTDGAGRGLGAVGEAENQHREKRNQLWGKPKRIFGGIRGPPKGCLDTLHARVTEEA